MENDLSSHLGYYAGPLTPTTKGDKDSVMVISKPLITVLANTIRIYVSDAVRADGGRDNCDYDLLTDLHLSENLLKILNERET